MATRRASPRAASSPALSCAMLAPLMKERYPGTMGSTQGEMKEMTPASRAASSDTDPVITSGYTTRAAPDKCERVCVAGCARRHSRRAPAPHHEPGPPRPPRPQVRRTKIATLEEAMGHKSL